MKNTPDHRDPSARRGLLFGCMLAWALVLASSAEAQVGIVESPDGAGLARRLAAELRGRGYAVRSLSPELAVLDGQVEALVWTSDAPPGLRLCALTRAGVLRCEELRDEDGSVLVLLAMEVLRAHLGEPRTSSSEPVEPPEEVEEAASEEAIAPETCPEPIESRRTVELGAGVALLPPTSSLGVGFGVMAMVNWSPDPFVAFEVGGLVSLIDPTLSRDASSASFSTRMGWLGGDLRLPETLLGGHHLLVGLAVAVAGAEVHPGAAAPLDERALALTTFMPMARAAFVAHLDARLRVHVGARVGAALPQPVLFFADTEVARWGAPYWALELALAVALD